MLHVRNRTEQPFGKTGTRRRTLGAVASICVVTLASSAFALAAGSATSSAATRATVAPAPLRVLIVGDSTGEALTYGLTNWAKAHPGQIVIDHQALGGCALTDANAQDMISIPGHPELGWAPVSNACRHWTARMAAQRAFHPNVVLAVFGPTQVANLKPGNSATGTSILNGDLQWDAIAEASALRNEFPSSVFVWATAAFTFASSKSIPESWWLINNPWRIGEWNHLVSAFSTWHQSARLPMGDFINTDGYTNPSPTAWRNTTWRPDGTHMTGAALAKMAAWSITQIVNDYRHFHPTYHLPGVPRPSTTTTTRRVTTTTHATTTTAVVTTTTVAPDTTTTAVPDTTTTDTAPATTTTAA